MKLWTRLIAILAILTLVAAACGSDSEESATDDTTSTETETDDATEDDSDDAMEDDDSDDAMEEESEEPDEEPAPAGGAGEGGEIVMLQWQAPSQVNSLLSTGTKDLLAGSLVLEPLAEIAPDGSIVPALAAEIPTVDNGGVAADFTSVTWTLQEGILWSDGTPFTADDVVFTWEYCTDEETGCSADVFGSVDSVVANDATSVTINFTGPTPYPFEPFVAYGSPILQKAQMEPCIGAAAKSCSDQNFAPIGTGPYMVTDFRAEDTAVYAFNPNYRGVAEGKPFFSGVTIKGGGDAESTARSVLEVGDADYAWNLQVAPEILGAMEAAGNGYLLSGFAADVEHISLNQTDPFADPPSEGTPNPLFVDNPDLHRALSIAINRDELVAVGYGPTGQPTCNIWPVGSENSTNNDWCLTQDIDGANAILDELGYLDTDGDGIREADGYGPLEFDYVTSVNAVRQSNQELIADYWEDIGVKANMLAEDAGLFFDGTCAGNCIWKFPTPMQMYTNGTSSPYAGVYMNGYTSDKIPTSENSWGGNNIYRINSAEVDALTEEMLSLSPDDPRYSEVVIEINDIVSTSAIIPLIHRATPDAFSSDISGVGDLNGWDGAYWNFEDWVREG